MRRHIVLLMASLLAAAVTAGLATADDDEGDDDRGAVYAIGLWGDVPYSDHQKTHGVPNLIRD